ncbi:MAG TPA: PEP-CTERM sorting domain-containing protein [Verrucomicrobiae bacterium]|nr:PEP-CTERM sorting domain-containing protein [Verrucomicrobiae bacterium]
MAYSHKLVVVAGLIIALVVSRAQGAILWNEAVDGDLSGNQSAPNAFTLLPGTNAIIGSLRTSSSTDNQDWIALTVPSGMQLGAVVLKSYVSTDQQGFTGVQAGTNFVGSVNSPGSYLGYAHFGTGAQNGALPATNLVGVDILPIMGDTTLAVGSQGFTPPLGSGTYTFLIQQTGSAATSYEFDYVVIPEPATVLLVALGCGVIFLRRQRTV